MDYLQNVNNNKRKLFIWWIYYIDYQRFYIYLLQWRELLFGNKKFYRGYTFHMIEVKRDSCQNELLSLNEKDVKLDKYNFGIFHTCVLSLALLYR